MAEPNSGSALPHFRTESARRGPRPVPASSAGESAAANAGAASWTEGDVVEQIRRMLPEPPPGHLWLGDDAAVVPSPSGSLVLTMDAVVAGVHADLDLVGLDDFGWKALAVAVSDIAAMGARPLHALVAISAPRTTDLSALYRGLAASAVEHHTAVVGGDLSSSEQLMVAVAVTGTLDVEARVPAAGPPEEVAALGALTRGGARPGDTLLVTGPLGSSAAGLRLLRRQAASTDPSTAVESRLMAAHRRPRARLAQALAAKGGGAVAMIDVSDGLAIDLDRLALASGVGIRLVDVPVAEGATLDEALGGGEDYELIVATPDPERLQRAFAALDLDLPLVLGTCTAQVDERSLGGQPFAITGWEHPGGRR